MNLEGLDFMLNAQLKRTEDVFRHAILLTTTTAKDRLGRRYQLEGALSGAWQAYNTFVRLVCIGSARGCTTSSGISHAPSITPVSSERASYVAIRSGSQNTVQVGALNTVLRKEPTWGDSAKIVDIVDGLNPGNKGTLKQYLAGGLNGPKHSQTVRNACAHTNHQTKAEVSALAAYYIASPIAHPTDALTWIDPNSNEFAFISWLDDMRVIASGAVS